MKEITYDVAIIGAGPAGIAAAISAFREGAARVVIIERDKRLGGILQQCIHPGFGLKYFNDELTGPEYIGRFADELLRCKIDIMYESMVLNINDKKEIVCTNTHDGLVKVKSSSIVLAMGCRERTRGAISIPGSRPAGVFTAGSAQRLINIQGHKIGNEVVILGSGDIGMIMARRMTLEGAKVKAVVEILPYVSGLTRNKVQCLDDFGIPLYLSHTVTEIIGNLRVEKVRIAQVDSKYNAVPGTEREIPCDTLLLSVGLIPENEISKMVGIKLDALTSGPVVNEHMQTSVPGIFACGNVVHVNDLVDNVTLESQIAGKCAARYARKGSAAAGGNVIKVVPGDNVRYAMPQKIEYAKDVQDELAIYFRVQSPQEKVQITVECGDKIIFKEKKIRVRPGEMESVSLSKDILDTVSDKLVINVR